MNNKTAKKKSAPSAPNNRRRRFLFALGGILSLLTVSLTVFAAGEENEPEKREENTVAAVATTQAQPAAEEKNFRLEDAVRQNREQVPDPLEASWEKKVSYINEIELPSEVIYDFYEEELPEDIIEPHPGKQKTHPKISGIKVEVSRKPPYFGKEPVIAIVIDDMGVSRQRTARINSLSYPLTSSFLTYAPGLRQQIEDARKAGHEIIAHLPMEPKVSMNISPDVLTVGMNDEEVARGIKNMLDKFSQINGVNNHMGSRFTEDEPKMEIVMKELSARGLFFLDSKTTAHSVGEKAAKEYQVRYVSRNVFLDNEDKFDYIMRQLRQTEEIARKNGYAVAIGHPKEQTYNALKVWLPTLKSRGLRLVPLSEIVNVLN